MTTLAPNTHAIAAMIAANAKPFRLVTIPGVELPAAPFGCEWCFITHDAQHCPAIRAVLFADDPPVDIPDEPYPPTPGGPEPPEWRTN